MVLKVSQQNPRYFVDDNGRVVYLSCSYTWATFQSWGDAHPQINMTDYLNFIEEYNYNFIRLWVTDTASLDNGSGGYCEPQPYMRTGPGNALDGKLKFDLTKFNQSYFDELLSRITAAQNRGIYVSIMLFDTWGVGGYNNYGEWTGCPFNSSNNINDINGDQNHDGKGVEVHSLSISAITTIQELYVKKVIDTVNNLDNVLYEIINEGGNNGVMAWQKYLVNFIRNYETGKKQHPIGITSSESTLSEEEGNESKFTSNADWIAPYGLNNAPYAIDPPIDGRKVVINDDDHINLPRDSPDLYLPSIWVWKSFMRGLNPIHLEEMEELTGEHGQPGIINTRKAISYTLNYAKKIPLLSMIPKSSSTDCSTTYCISNPGSEYLFYQPSTGSFTANIISETYRYEWFNPSTGLITDSGTIDLSNGKNTFNPPFSGNAVLYLTTSDCQELQIQFKIKIL